MLKKIFKTEEKKEMIEKNKRLKEKLEELENEIRKKAMIINCKNLSQLKNREEILSEQPIEEKDWSKIENELKNYHSENIELKKILLERERIHGLKDLSYNYYIELERYFKEAKYKVVLEYFDKISKKYVQELTEEEIDRLEFDKKLKDEFKEKYLKFKDYKVNWEIKTNIIKGVKLSKLYSKYRKLVNIFTNDNIEYASDLLGYNFNLLKESGYKKEEIEEFKKIYSSYVDEYRFKRERSYDINDR